jgi:hypothetical protein
MEPTKTKQEVKVISTREKQDLITKMIIAYKATQDKNKVYKKNDLTFRETMYLLQNRGLDEKIATLMLNKMLDFKSNLSKWSKEALTIFKDDFNDIKIEETIDIVRDKIIKIYEEYDQDGKRITASKIPVYKIIDMIITTGRNINLKDLYTRGGNLNWRLSNLNKEALTIIYHSLTLPIGEDDGRA